MEYGLIGEHLKHSFSKEIHEYIAGYDYELKEIAPFELSSFLINKDFKAINVTIPYKELVIPYLDFISEEAREVGAINVIVNKENKLYGYNTDVSGFIYLVKKSNIEIKNKNVLILGDGGASKAIKVAIKKLEAKNIFIASRKNKDDTISYDDIYKINDINVVINTTPVGMYPHEDDELLIDLSRFKKIESVIDIIYNPLKTRLIIKAEELGLKVGQGLYMLVGQAYEAIQIFLDKKIDINYLEKTYQKIKKEKSNIVLIGMPSSGKSQIASLLKERLNLEVVDIDSEIIKIINMPIKEYFSRFGEEKFRELEHQIILENYQKTPLIISTGGGVIKNKDNIDLLKHNGTIFFLNRDIDKLFASDDRPLSSNFDDLNKLYLERIDLYKKYCDYEIDNNKDISRAVEEIIKAGNYEENINN